jgi:hypothetical protein
MVDQVGEANEEAHRAPGGIEDYSFLKTIIFKKSIPPTNAPSLPHRLTCHNQEAPPVSDIK